MLPSVHLTANSSAWMETNQHSSLYNPVLADWSWLTLFKTLELPEQNSIHNMYAVTCGQGSKIEQKV